ncbi:MAG TPA: nitroreductase family deazaflavin-dependent oxidoreductase [Solirubrobacterales bacterium]|jgi:deazaflavin-dependent oxidoreductase (nitroreductase family)
MDLLDRRPGRLTSAVLRAPGWLYRLHLGWVLGDRFLYFSHRGRRTGRTRHTIVEVVRFDRGEPEATVVAGWGPGTQWYRNLEAAPAEEVVIGRRRWPHPGHRFLDEPERGALLRSYADEHPRAARGLGRAFGVPELDDRAIARLAERTRAVAFRPFPAARAVRTGA